MHKHADVIKIKKQKATFVLVSVAIFFGAPVLALLVLDFHFHEKFNNYSMGYNIRGYRGPLLGPKPKGGHRVVVLGGSTAAGYGVGVDQTMPAFLGRALKTNFTNSAVDVANLGWNVQGVYSFPFTIESYADLKPDLWVFYIGYTDAGINTFDWRKDSLCFRLTGYMPIWPLIFREKAMALLSGGNLDQMYRDPKIVFTPALSSKIVGTALHGTVNAVEGMEKILERWAQQKPSPNKGGRTVEPQDAFSFYLHWVDQSIQRALSISDGSVLLLGQPRIGDWHASQQKALHEFFLRHYADHSRVFYLDMALAIDLKDRNLAPDGMHLSSQGNEILAKKVSPVVGQILGLSSPGF